MRVCHKHIVDRRRVHRYLLIDIQIRSLFHTAVHQYMLIRKLQIMTASCHLVCSPQKFKLHMHSPQHFFDKTIIHVMSCGYNSFPLSLFSQSRAALLKAHNFFLQASHDFFFKTRDVGLGNPQQICHLFLRLFLPVHSSDTKAHLYDGTFSC